MKNTSAEFITHLVSIATEYSLDDNNWRIFGFKNRPKRGTIFNRFINKNQLQIENFLILELFLSCIAYGINITNSPNEYKAKLAAGVFEYYFFSDGILEVYNFSTYEECFNYYLKINDYLRRSNDNHASIFISHSQNELGSIFKGSWLVYVSRLYVESPIKALSTVITNSFEFPLLDDTEIQNQHILECFKI